jgi:zinc transport system permease protein
MIFIRYALIAALVSAVAFGTVGTFVVVKRMSSVAGAVSHATLAGIGVALFLKGALGYNWIDPKMGAFIAALFAAFAVWAVKQYAAEREDTIIGAVWAVGMALGLLFIAKTPIYVDPMTYLFGNILLISAIDIVLMAIWDVVILILLLLYYRQVQTIAFDEEYAALRGIPVPLYSFLFLQIIAVTIVLLVSVTGVVMVIAMMTLPAAIAGRHFKHLKSIMVAASLLTVFFIAGGLWISYELDFPTGPLIIIFAGIAYLANLLLLRIKKGFASLK